MRLIREGKHRGSVEMSKGELSAALQFASKDDLRPHMHCVVLQSDGVYATDGHALVASQWEPLSKPGPRPYWHLRPVIIDRLDAQRIAKLIPAGGLARVKPRAKTVFVEFLGRAFQEPVRKGRRRGKPPKTPVKTVAKRSVVCSLVVPRNTSGVVPPPYVDVLKLNTRLRDDCAGKVGFNAQLLGRLEKVQTVTSGRFVKGCHCELGGELDGAFFYFDNVTSEESNPWTVVVMPMRVGERARRAWEVVPRAKPPTEQAKPEAKKASKAKPKRRRASK